MDPLTDSRLAIGDLVCENRELRRKLNTAFGVIADIKSGKIDLALVEILPEGGFTVHPGLPPGAKAIAAELLAKARERQSLPPTNGEPCETATAVE